MTPRLFLEDKILHEKCLIGQMAKCCKFLVAGHNGFACGKLDRELRRQIDKLKFIAKGDNCDGIPMLNGDKISRN